MKLNHTQDVTSPIKPLSPLLVIDHDLPASPRTLPLSTDTKTDLIQQGLAALKTCNFAGPRSRALAAGTRDNTASSGAQLALLLDSGASFHIDYLVSRSIHRTLRDTLGHFGTPQSDLYDGGLGWPPFICEPWGSLETFF